MSDIIPNESHNSLKIPALLHRLLGEQFPKEAARIEAGLLCQRRTTLRVNALKTTAEAVRETLSSHNIAYRTVSWYHDALILEGEDGKRAVEALPLYERGEIYFQSLSSMLPPLVLCPKAGESILDMTAAPGGKTTELAALSEGGVLITACEKDKIRFERLKFNLSRQGAGKVNALHADATKLDDFFRFDKILLDAPCSGSGTADALNGTFCEKLLSSCVKAQEQLLKKAIKILKRGGTLVYSTCSLLSCENEALLSRVLKGTDCALSPIDLKANGDLPLLESSAGTLTVLPDEHFEGFFVAKIIKY